MEKIYIISHQCPDLDSVAASIALAELKNALHSDYQYIPARLGKINKETEYILDKYGFEVPRLLTDGTNKKLILVDHNEESQSIKNREKGEVLEILDHHKINFSSHFPLFINIKPWGSSCSILYEEFEKNKVKISRNLAGILLSAVLSDTVITKSPTCTPIDKKIITSLAKIAKVSDWKKHGLKQFKVKSNIASMSNSQILTSDLKFFKGSIDYACGQIETVCSAELKSRENLLLQDMKKFRLKKKLHTVILLITDIIKEGSQILVASKNDSIFEKSLNVKLKNSRVFVPGIMSRKKQIAPKMQ